MNSIVTLAVTLLGLAPFSDALAEPSLNVQSFLPQQVPASGSGRAGVGAAEEDYDVVTDLETVTNYRTILKGKSVVPPGLLDSHALTREASVKSQVVDVPANPTFLPCDISACQRLNSLAALGEISSTASFMAIPSSSAQQAQGSIESSLVGGVKTSTAGSSPTTSLFAESSKLSANLDSGLKTPTASLQTPSLTPTTNLPKLSQMASPSSGNSALIQGAESSDKTILSGFPSQASKPTPTATGTASTCTANGVVYENGQEINDSSNVTYVVRCSQDNSEGSFSVVGVSTGGFSICFAVCSITTGCAGFTYSGTDAGNCYLKHKQGNFNSAPNTIVSAFRTDGSGGVVAAASDTMGSGSRTTSEASVSSSSCAGLAAQGSTYATKEEVAYSLKCGFDCPGRDIGAKSSNSFQECFQHCDSTLGCGAFAYLGGSGAGTCYLKGDVGSCVPASNGADSALLIPDTHSSSSMLSTSASGSQSATGSQGSNAAAGTSLAITPAASSVTSSSSTPAASPGSCDSIGQGLHKSLENITYKVSCKHDVGGADLAALSAPTFESCFAICDANAQCAGFSWLVGSGPGTCYLKSSFNGESSVSSADVAIAVDKPAVSPALSSPKSGSTAPVATSGMGNGQAGNDGVASSTGQVKPTSAPSKDSCAGVGDGAVYNGYEVSCGVDHYGGGLASRAAQSFSACIPICDTTQGCVGFAFTGGSGSGTCFLKSYIAGSARNANVDFAQKRGSASIAATFSNAGGKATPLSTQSRGSQGVAGTVSSAMLPTDPGQSTAYPVKTISGDEQQSSQLGSTITASLRTSPEGAHTSQAFATNSPSRSLESPPRQSSESNSAQPGSHSSFASTTNVIAGPPLQATKSSAYSATAGTPIGVPSETGPLETTMPYQATITAASTTKSGIPGNPDIDPSWSFSFGFPYFDPAEVLPDHPLDFTTNIPSHVSTFAASHAIALPTRSADWGLPVASQSDILPNQFPTTLQTMNIPSLPTASEIFTSAHAGTRHHDDGSGSSRGDMCPDGFVQMCCYNSVFGIEALCERVSRHWTSLAPFKAECEFIGKIPGCYSDEWDRFLPLATADGRPIPFGHF